MRQTLVCRHVRGVAQQEVRASRKVAACPIYTQRGFVATETAPTLPELCRALSRLAIPSQLCMHALLALSTYRPCGDHDGHPNGVEGRRRD